jgi:hypothetical protein
MTKQRIEFRYMTNLMSASTSDMLRLNLDNASDDENNNKKKMEITKNL